MLSNKISIAAIVESRTFNSQIGIAIFTGNANCMLSEVKMRLSKFTDSHSYVKTMLQINTYNLTDVLHFSFFRLLYLTRSGKLNLS